MHSFKVSSSEGLARQPASQSTRQGGEPSLKTSNTPPAYPRQDRSIHQNGSDQQRPSPIDSKPKPERASPAQAPERWKNQGSAGLTGDDRVQGTTASNQRQGTTSPTGNRAWLLWPVGKSEVSTGGRPRATQGDKETRGSPRGRNATGARNSSGTGTSPRHGLPS